VIGESGEARLIAHGNAFTALVWTIAVRYPEAHLQVRSRSCSVVFRKIDNALNSFRSRRGLPRRGGTYSIRPLKGRYVPSESIPHFQSEHDKSLRHPAPSLFPGLSVKKENEILLRGVGKQRVHFNVYDMLCFVVLSRAADIRHRLILDKPETLLCWQRTLRKRFWTFEHRPANRGRRPVDTDVKNLALSMTNDNLL